MIIFYLFMKSNRGLRFAISAVIANQGRVLPRQDLYLKYIGAKFSSFLRDRDFDETMWP